MSSLLIKILLIQYVVILGASLVEGNYPRALYWFGASLLQVSILWMG